MLDFAPEISLKLFMGQIIAFNTASAINNVLSILQNHLTYFNLRPRN